MRRLRQTLNFLTHVFRFDLKYSLNSLVEQVTRIFILHGTRRISKENVSRFEGNVFQILNPGYTARTSIRVGQELRSTSPVFPGVLINLLENLILYQRNIALMVPVISLGNYSGRFGRIPQIGFDPIASLNRQKKFVKRQPLNQFY